MKSAEKIIQLIIIHSNVTQSVSKPPPMRYASRTGHAAQHTQRKRERDMKMKQAENERVYSM